MSSIAATGTAYSDQIWDGGGTDAKWNTLENWGGDTLPNFANAIVFTGTAQTSTMNDLAAGTTIGGISFTNTTGSAFILSGNSITLGGSIQTSANTAGSTFTDVIDLNIAIARSVNRSISVNQQNASVQHNLTISGNISTGNGAGTAFTKSGSGVLTLSGSNSGVQELVVAAGTLVFQGASSTGSGPIQATSGGTARFVSDSNFTSSAGLRNYSGTGNFVFDRATAGSGDGLTFAFTNAVGGNFDFAHNTVNNFTAGANITSGTPTVTLNNMRSQSSTNAQAVQLLPVGVNLSMGAVTVGGNTKLRTWELGGTSQGNIITGAISNAGGASTTSITKSNSSAWTLTSTSNSYTGATNINGGTLRINGSTNTNSAFTVASLGTLAGGGTVGGSVTLSGKLAPGNGTTAIGKLKTGSLTVNSGSIFQFDLATSDNDELQVTGNFNKGTDSGSGFVFNFMGTPEANKIYTLVTWTTASANPFTASEFSFTGLASQFVGTNQFKIEGNSLQFTPVPEASNLLIGGLVGLGLLTRRRKQK